MKKGEERDEAKAFKLKMREANQGAGEREKKRDAKDRGWRI